MSSHRGITGLWVASRVTKLLSTARHNSLGRWGGAGVPPIFVTLKLRLGSDKVSPVLAWFCCDKAFLSLHTFSTDEELLTHQKCDDYVILRHVQPPLAPERNPAI